MLLSSHQREPQRQKQRTGTTLSSKRCSKGKSLLNTSKISKRVDWIEQEMMLYSQKIETVRKQSFFSEELTEEERDIVAKRVALQQRQFAEYERREKIRKSKTIQAMFEHVNTEEIQEMLLDCDENEACILYFKSVV